MLGISCEKENELLSDFVVGDWKSQELNLGDSPLGYFTATLKTTNTYVLTFTLSDGSQTMTCPETDYWIDNDNDKITIVQPDFDPNDDVTPTETVTFSVIWGGDVMTWTPDDASGDDPPPVLTWTRQ